MNPDKQNQTSRRNFFRKSLAASAGVLALQGTTPLLASPEPAPSKIWITDLKSALIQGHVVVRITTNAGVNGYAMAEFSKPYLKPFVQYYKDYIVGMDPTDVGQIMAKIRRLGSFKPWGAAVSSIEMALWDIAGKVANVPVYKLLGGKLRSKVRVYSGGGKPAMTKFDPEEFAKVATWVKEAKEGYTMAKFAIAFHSSMPLTTSDFYYGTPVSPNTPPQPTPKNIAHPYRGNLTEKGLKHVVSCVEAIKKVLGESIGVALDLGPGHSVTDAIRMAKALEPYNLLWMEDMITGDYTPYVMADRYREVTLSTTTPIHTGEQIYLREHFKELFEKQAVRVIGPDPADMGGIAELKWVCEYADLYGIQLAPHGVGDGVLGLAALVQSAAALPDNYIAFEYPVASPEWYEMVDGLPDPIVKNGHIEVWDKPGMGVEIRPAVAKKYLSAEDKGFFD